MEISVRQGSREPIVFTITADGSALNLAGREIRMRRRDYLGNEDTFSTADASPLLVITDADNGEVTFSPAADTWGDNIADYKIYFDVQDGAKFVAWPEAEDIIVKLVDDFG